MASKEFTDRFNKFRESLIEVKDLFYELYLSSELELADLNVNFMKILDSLANAVTYTNRELKILKRGNNGEK